MTTPTSLPNIIAQALLPGEVKAPDALVREIIAQKSSIDVFTNEEVLRRLFEALYLEFPSLSSAARAHQIHQIDMLAGLLRWLIQELRRWRMADDKSTEKLVAIIVVAQASDAKEQLWAALPSDIGANRELLDAFRRLVGSFSVKFVSRDATRTPLWESEAVERFKEADAAADWAEIGRRWQAFEHVAHASILQRQVVRALYRYHFDGLVDASDRVSATAIAMQIAEVLEPQQRLELAVACQSPYIQFASTYLTVSRMAGTQPLSPSEISSMVKLLTIVATDATRWAGWMRAFNAYPVRYPGLQVPLGRALADATDEAIEAYLNSIVLLACQVASPAVGTDQVADCLREFRSVAGPDRRRFLWRRAHERWLQWGFDQANLDTNLFTVNRCQLDYALVGYACECMDQPARDKALDEIRQQLERVEDEWHSSITDVITVWNRLLSQMQPYAHAQQVVASGVNWWPINQYFLPFDPTKERYLPLKYKMA